MWLQATGLNPLSGSIIFPYVHPSSRLRASYDFMSVYLVVRGPFWTRINTGRRWTLTLKMNLNTFPVWGYVFTHIFKIIHVYICINNIGWTLQSK